MNTLFGDKFEILELHSRSQVAPNRPEFPFFLYFIYFIYFQSNTKNIRPRYLSTANVRTYVVVIFASATRQSSAAGVSPQTM